MNIKNLDGELKNFHLFMAFVNLIAAIYNTNLSPMVLSISGNNDL
jgi:hypothetical protein